jgi:hypothetical protein
MGCTGRSERLGVLANCVGQDMRRLKVIHRGGGLCGCPVNGNDGVVGHLFLLKLRVVRLYASDHCFLLPQDHSFLVALRDMKSPDMDFFYQNKAALDDEGLFHHRKYCRIAFLPNGRDGFDLTANRYSFDLHPFVLQRFIDESLVLARTSNSSSGRSTQKTARAGRSDLERLRRYSVAPEASFIGDDLVGRSGLMLTASSGTVTRSPSGLFALLFSTPDRSLREEMTDGTWQLAVRQLSSFTILISRSGRTMVALWTDDGPYEAIGGPHDKCLPIGTTPGRFGCCRGLRLAKRPELPTPSDRQAVLKTFMPTLNEPSVGTQGAVLRFVTIASGQRRRAASVCHQRHASLPSVYFE